MGIDRKNDEGQLGSEKIRNGKEGKNHRGSGLVQHFL
jgi:hypothetical protein